MILGWTKTTKRVRHRGKGGAFQACLTFGVAVTSACPAIAAPPLRIATWDVSQVEKEIFARPKHEKKSSWRHTFGSERFDTKKTRLGIFNLDVDVVLLQGVQNVRALRRVFPTRTWKLILSRDYMRNLPPLSRLPADLQIYDIAATEANPRTPVTAVALRYQRRLRVRAIKHISVDETLAKTGSAVSTIPAATAIRINHFGAQLWLVSLALSEHCAEDHSTCPPWVATKKWFNDLNEFDQVPAVAGRSVPKPSPTPADKKTQKTSTKPCGDLVAVSESCLQRGCIGTMKTRTRKKLGCIVVTTVSVPQRVPQRHPATTNTSQPIPE